MELVVEVLKTKKCFSCHLEKSVDDFYKSSDQLFQGECKQCTRVRRSLWWKSAAGKKSSKRSKLKAKFGITLEDYEQLLEIADNKCEICGAVQSESNHLCVDHNHTTGNIRGMLCKNCNLGIGNLRDDTTLLQNAIDYINKKGN